MIFMVNRQQEAFAEQIISNEDCNLIFPQCIQRKEASSFIGIINHIIMNECGSVK